MKTVEIQKNQFGGWWVDTIEVEGKKRRIVETKNFKDYREASAFWAEQAKKYLAGVAK